MNKPYAITLDVGSSLVNHTGSWRTRRPVYVDKLPPCNNACPAGENIQAWLFQAEEGNYRAAWEEIIKNNPMPAIMGRVCYHSCETACNRGDLDESVGIHAVERFLGDKANKAGWKVEFEADSSGMKVLVIGSGPAGLSAAYHLTLLGHQVTIYEAAEKPGGMMRYGIPRYRLPRGTLDADIQRIIDMGVELKLNTRIDNLQEAKDDGGFDAVFLAVGAHKGNTLDIPTTGSAKIYDAVTYLANLENEDGNYTALGNHVVVYGGGNTAMDVARSATRTGAESVTVVYRRQQDQMPAHEFEIREALEEGVKIIELAAIKQFDVDTLMLEKNRIDADGRVIGTGEYDTIPADALVLAVGQTTDFGVLGKGDGFTIEDKVLTVDNSFYTGVKGVFAGGDMVPSPRTVTTGIGHGKHAARAIDAWLKDEHYEKPVKHDLANYEGLNTWYYTDAPKTEQPVLELIRRQSGFEEVLGDLNEKNALFEARRCLSCGNCFECDTCYGVCPDNAVIKLGPGKRFQFNYDYCKGCGMCVAECPCGAIVMEQENI